MLCAGACAGAFAQATPVGREFQVNSYTPGIQQRPAAAAAGDGGFVVVWESYGRDGSSWGVFARRFDASGIPQGAEFQVNSYTTFFQISPAVAMDGDGDFVVTWTSYQGGLYTNVFARRFNAAGTAQAAEFLVNSFTPYYQRSSAVALDGGGDFVVAWESYMQDGDGWGIFAQRFDAAGVFQATEFKVNTENSIDQENPAIGIDGSGAFVVAWESGLQDGSQFGVFARRFSVAGVAQAVEFQVNSFTPDHQWEPTVAMDGGGDFVIGWRSTVLFLSSEIGLFARRFDATGAPLASEFQVNSHTTSSQSPAAAIDGDGDFVVAWHSFGQDGSDFGVFARRFDATGAPLASEFQVNSYTTNTQRSAVVAADGDGDFVVAWQSQAQDGSELGIFAQRFVVPKTFDIDANGATDALTDGLLFLRYLFGFRGATLITGAIAGNCTRCLHPSVESYLGGLTALGSAKPAGPEFQVNAYTAGYQLAPTAVTDGDGDFVVVWHSAHEGSSYGIIARRFASSGMALAPEFLVNAYLTGTQNYAAVAADADGDFVVAWQSDGQDGSGRGVFARRFNSAGVALVAEFQVNAFTPGDQLGPSVAMSSTGAFVVAWHSYGQDGAFDYGVFARRFDAAGQPQGGELQVNTLTAYDEGRPAVAMQSTGAFVVAWESFGDGSYRASSRDASTPPASRRPPSSRSTPTPRTISSIPPSTPTLREASWWRGRASSRTVPTPESSLGASTPRERRRPVSFKSTPTPPATSPDPRWEWKPVASSS